MNATPAPIAALLLALLPGLCAAAVPAPVSQRGDSCVIMEVSQAKADGNSLVWNIELKQPGNYVVQLVVANAYFVPHIAANSFWTWGGAR